MRAERPQPHSSWWWHIVPRFCFIPLKALCLTFVSSLCSFGCNLNVIVSESVCVTCLVTSEPPILKLELTSLCFICYAGILTWSSFSIFIIRESPTIYFLLLQRKFLNISTVKLCLLSAVTHSRLWVSISVLTFQVCGIAEFSKLRLDNLESTHENASRFWFLVVTSGQ